MNPENLLPIRKNIARINETFSTLEPHLHKLPLRPNPARTNKLHSDYPPGNLSQTINPLSPAATHESACTFQKSIPKEGRSAFTPAAPHRRKLLRRTSIIAGTPARPK